LIDGLLEDRFVLSLSALIKEPAIIIIYLREPLQPLLHNLLQYKLGKQTEFATSSIIILYIISNKTLSLEGRGSG